VTRLGFLSRQLGLKRKKKLAKFVDEYNWVTITRDLKLPPRGILLEQVARQ